jgi:thymidylate synthase
MYCYLKIFCIFYDRMARYHVLIPLHKDGKLGSFESPVITASLQRFIENNIVITNAALFGTELFNKRTRQECTHCFVVHDAKELVSSIENRESNVHHIASLWDVESPTVGLFAADYKIYGDTLVYVIVNDPVICQYFINKSNTLRVLFMNQNSVDPTNANVDPIDISSFMLSQYEPNINGVRELTYKRDRSGVMHGEYVYLDELRDIMSTQQNRGIRPDRTGVGTLSVFGRQLRFDISESIPFLTTKQLAWRAVLKELLWFLRGETDSKKLEADGVNIWKLNSTSEFIGKRGLPYREGDIGSMYGWIWRHVGAEYRGCDAEYTDQGFNQLDWLVNSIRTDPFSRRHLITTFSPEYMEKGVLYPCHGIVTQMNVDEIEGVKYLSCQTYCRSQDTFLGQPFNIASYAILTYIIAKKCGMRPKELIISTGDTHIYQNHLEQVQLQLARKPFPFPKLLVHDSVYNKTWDELTMEDFDVIGYIHHPSIKANMAV